MITSEVEELHVCCVSNDGQGRSVFSQQSIELFGSSERRLSEQIAALNFRMRSSDSSYSSDFHVAGDPTLLVVLNGKVKIELRNAEVREFAAGEMFIAKDYLAWGIEFDSSLHGHRAQVVGDEPISVLHLKLDRAPLGKRK